MMTWTVARQAPLSMGFFRQEYWDGLPFPTPGNLPNPGIEPTSLVSPAPGGRFFTTELYPTCFQLCASGGQLTWKAWTLCILGVVSESGRCSGKELRTEPGREHAFTSGDTFRVSLE